MKLHNVPYDFVASQGSDWKVDNNSGRVTTTAPGHSDIFIDPGRAGSVVSSASRHNAATLMTRIPAGDFQFSATVHVEFGATFDAGVLLLRVDESTWAKLCFEYSPDGEPMVVSVINKGGTSDDANAFTVDGKQVNLRISRKENVYALHASVDGVKWIFVRAFAFDNTEAEPEIGFEAQSPNADGCNVSFSNYALTDVSIADFRNGL
ncbi:hypothetical protein AO825_06565 [Pectobacterium brasiliense]|uniref:DUF1349 domain-containing protein n=1 Tax=Gammaproteobacteria TaxID=1236 RepID=UPI0001A43018|nr:MULTISPECIES: DUF1349 domain-containing protein [Enterobacterales]KGA23320.1 hypothetical protein KS44_13570 [Pectobacterium brasiliense]KRF64020.1 hypothetical protein AO825_06565 [Pectobacterium brasiliense]MBN3187538.1 DUF1349 domain-containing protein [Pectobacterium brasiliense]MCK7449430.1 DUF1349 domain-containing protein [Enterobacter bugandensis]QHG29020.1 DUF1349 domain-containing protein [Pectobacterium brasiliense]